jgi:hypothetical protein
METHPAVVFTPLDDNEGILLHLVTKRYYTLNESGCRIWELAAAGQTEAQIARALTEQYALDEADARAHTDALLRELATEHLILTG